MIDPRINLRNRDLMACHALQKLRARTAGSIWVWESFCQLSIEELRELPVLVVLSFLVLKANQDSPFRYAHRRSSTWFHHEHHVLQLSRGPAATTKVVSQSREAPAIAKFNLEFSEIETSRRVGHFNVESITRVVLEH
jgi:hypothetical protein